MAADYKHQVRDPENPDEATVEVIFPADWTLKLYKTDPVGYENLRVAKYVLDNPARLFRGLRRYNRDGWCYVGAPTEWHIRPAVVAPFPHDLVFEVYVNPRLRIFEARAEPQSVDDPMSPEDWANRYEALIWKRTS